MCVRDFLCHKRFLFVGIRPDCGNTAVLSLAAGKFPSRCNCQFSFLYPFDVLFSTPPWLSSTKPSAPIRHCAPFFVSFPVPREPHRIVVVLFLRSKICILFPDDFAAISFHSDLHWSARSRFPSRYHVTARFITGLVPGILPGSNKTDDSTHADSSSANDGEMRGPVLNYGFF